MLLGKEAGGARQEGNRSSDPRELIASRRATAVWLSIQDAYKKNAQAHGASSAGDRR